MLLICVEVSAYKPVTICYENRDYPPYSMGASDVAGAEQGILPELINAAITDLGMQVNYKPRPWKRCIAEIKAGRVDGIFAAIWLPERDSWGYFPKLSVAQEDKSFRLATASYRIFTHRHGKLAWDGSTFSGMVRGVGAPLGYVAFKKLNTLKVLSAKTYDPVEGLKAVADGKLDAYVLEGIIGTTMLEREGLTNVLTTLPKPFFSRQLFLPFSHQFSKRHRGLAEKIWQRIKQNRD